MHLLVCCFFGSPLQGPPSNEETKERMANGTKPCDERKIRRCMLHVLLRLISLVCYMHTAKINKYSFLLSFRGAVAKNFTDQICSHRHYEVHVAAQTVKVCLKK